MFQRLASLVLSLVAAVMLAAGCAGKGPLDSNGQHKIEQIDTDDKSEVSPAAKVAPGIPVTVTVRVLRGDKPFAHITGFQFEMGRSVSGQKTEYVYQCRTDGTTGIGTMEINNFGDRRFPSAGGYYVARIIDPVSRDTVGAQSSIPVASNAMYLECVFSEKGEFVAIRPYTPEVAIKVAKNTAMADATQYSPTAVLASTSVKVGSAVLSVDKNGDYYFSAMTLASNLPAGVLGRAFRNLKVMFRNTQIGVTWGTLNDGPISFQFGHSAVLPAGTQMVVDLYADVSSSISAEDLAAINNSPNGILRILPIKAMSMVSGAEIQSLGEVRLQRLYLVDHGQINFQLSPQFNYSKYLIAGQQYTAGWYRLTASPAEAMNLQALDFRVSVSSGNARQMIERSWIQDNGLLSVLADGVFGQPDQGSEAMLWFDFSKSNRGYAIPAATFKDIAYFQKLANNVPLGTEIRNQVETSLFSYAYGQSSASKVMLDITPYDWHYKVVAEAGDRWLVYPIVVEGGLDWRKGRDGAMTSFATSHIGQDLVIDIEFKWPNIKASFLAQALRLVFDDQTGSVVNIKSSEIQGSRVTFRVPWDGSSAQVNLSAAGVDQKYYGVLMFFLCN